MSQNFTKCCQNFKSNIENMKRNLKKMSTEQLEEIKSTVETGS